MGRPTDCSKPCLLVFSPAPPSHPHTSVNSSSSQPMEMGPLNAPLLYSQTLASSLPRPPVLGHSAPVGTPCPQKYLHHVAWLGFCSSTDTFPHSTSVPEVPLPPAFLFRQCFASSNISGSGSLSSLIEILKHK